MSIANPNHSILRKNPYTRRRSFVARAMGLTPIGDIANPTLTESGGAAETLTWETATDWDSAVSESGVAHESVTNTDHGDSTVIRQGYTYSSPFLSANLDAYWPFHEDSGTTANDISGNGHDGAISGASLGNTGLLGTTTYDFVRSNSDNVSTTFAADYGTSEFTFAAWINTDSVYSGSEGAIFESYDGSSGIIASIDDGLWRWWLSGDSIKPASPTPSIGTHHFYTGVRRASSIELYIDGSSVGSTSATPNVTSTENVMFAKRNSGAGGGNAYDGGILEPRFYATAFSTANVQTLYDVVDTPGTITTATKSFTSATSPDLQNLSYTLNGVADIQCDVIGSPGLAGEEIVTQQLAGATSYDLTWSNTHTDFRVKLYPDNESDVTRSPTINRIELTTP